MFKGNRKKYDISQGKQRFSIRKFKFGAASIAIAFMVGGQAVVSAAEPNTVTSDTAVNANVIPAKESKATRQDVTSQPTATTETPKTETPKTETPKKEEVKKEKEKTSDTSLDNELKTPNLDINQLIRGGARTVAEDGGDVWSSQIGNVQTKSKEFNDGALKNVKSYISEDKYGSAGQTEIANRYRTIEKTEIKARYVEENGQKYIDYDIYFQNDGKSLTGNAQNAFWFYGPRDIMDLGSGGVYNSDTLTNRSFTRYKLKPGMQGHLSQNPERFEQVGSTFNIPNGDYGEKDAPNDWRGKNFYQLSGGPNSDNQRQQMLKNLAGNAELNKIIRRSNNQYPNLSYSQLMTVGSNQQYAYKYHVRVKLKSTVTQDEADKSGVIAVTAKAGLASEAKQAYVMAAMGSKLGKTQSEEYSPVGNLLTVQKGHKITAEDLGKHITHREGTKPLPAGYTVEAISVPETNSVGDYTAQALVRYPDGSREFVNVPVKVVDKDTQAPTLKVEAEKSTAIVGEDYTFTVTAEDDHKVNLDITDFTKKFTTDIIMTRIKVDYLTKTDTKVVMKVTISKVTLKDKKSVTFRATDDAGNKAPDQILDINVIEPDKDKYQPEYPSATGKPGDSVTLEPKDKTGKQIPDGTKYKVKDGSDITVDENTGKATVKIPADKKPGDVIEGKVTVTYPDGTTDEVPVKVTVSKTPDNITYSPEAKDQTVEQGTKPKAEDSIGNKDDLPKDSTYTWKKEPDTATPGEKEGVVEVTYPDGSKDEVPVKVTVTPKKTPDNENYQPEYPSATGKPGDSVTLEPKDKTGKQIPDGTKYKVKDGSDITVDENTGKATVKIPADKKPGDVIEGKVTVTYPDGTTDEVPVKVTVSKTPDNITYSPEAKDQTVEQGTKPKAEDSIGNKDDLPKDSTYTWKKEPDTATPGEKEGVVEVTYPDGSKDEVPVKVTVTPKKTPDNENYQPEYPSATGKPGDSVTLEPKDKTGKQIPDGTKYKVKDGSDITVDENTGKATVKIPADKKPGDVIEGKVTVTYPDGTTDEVPVKVTVSKTPDNITYSPEAKDQTVEQGTKPKAEDSIGNKDDLPKDSTYTWKKEPDTATPGEKEGVVEVTYPDGSKDEVPVKVTVTPKKTPDNENYQPEYPSATGKPGDSVTLEPKDKTGKQIPDGTKYKVKDGSDITVDENTGKATVKIPADKKPGDVIEGKVTVTYPDGTTDEVPVKVTVSKTPDNITYSPEAKDQTVEQGTKPKAEDSIGNKDDLPKDSTYTWKKEPDTATPGEKEGVVEVTYPDGSKDEVPVKVTVTPKKTPDNENYQPEYPSAAGKPGDTVEVPVKEKEGKTIPTGTTFTTPSGTGITVDKETGKVTVKIPADKKPGDVIEGKVTVTYPDGTTDEVPVKVTVKEKPTDADTHEPKGKDQTVKTGETPKAEDSIANIPDLPKGTKFEFESPVDTTTPGDKTAKVKVTYPDGSKDEVTVTIHVEKKATDADTHEPKGKDQTVKTGETPKAEDSIANIPDLPKGTKFEFESPVDTTTPGDKTAKVKVTYPDGSKDEVTVTIHVEKKATDADTHEPKGKDQTVKTGETPKAEDSIANIPDLPKGTKFEFESPVDTTTPGDKTAKVKVTYPDGSKDEVTVTIHVEKKATDGNHSNGDDVTGNQINSATKTLPNTGSTVNPFFTAAAMAAIVGAGTLYGVARKKHEDDAND